MNSHLSESKEEKEFSEEAWKDSLLRSPSSTRSSPRTPSPLGAKCLSLASATLSRTHPSLESHRAEDGKSKWLQFFPQLSETLELVERNAHIPKAWLIVQFLNSIKKLGDVTHVSSCNHRQREIFSRNASSRPISNQKTSETAAKNEHSPIIVNVKHPKSYGETRLRNAEKRNKKDIPAVADKPENDLTRSNPPFSRQGTFSPFRDPPLTLSASDGGKTGTTALIRSPGVIYTSPPGTLKDAKYSNTLKQKHEGTTNVVNIIKEGAMGSKKQKAKDPRSGSCYSNVSDSSFGAGGKRPRHKASETIPPPRRPTKLQKLKRDSRIVVSLTPCAIPTCASKKHIHLRHFFIFMKASQEHQEVSRRVFKQYTINFSKHRSTKSSITLKNTSNSAPIEREVSHVSHKHSSGEPSTAVRAHNKRNP
nr:hypothetical protein Iba_chr13aCG14170 [Ipomoea batatas]